MTPERVRLGSLPVPPRGGRRSTLPFGPREPTQQCFSILT